jgi:hypothetical protein
MCNRFQSRVQIYKVGFLFYDVLIVLAKRSKVESPSTFVNLKGSDQLLLYDRKL